MHFLWKSKLDLFRNKLQYMSLKIQLTQGEQNLWNRHYWDFLPFSTGSSGCTDTTWCHQRTSCVVSIWNRSWTVFGNSLCCAADRFQKIWKSWIVWRVSWRWFIFLYKKLRFLHVHVWNVHIECCRFFSAHLCPSLPPPEYVWSSMVKMKGSSRYWLVMLMGVFQFWKRLSVM